MTVPVMLESYRLDILCCPDGCPAALSQVQVWTCSSPQSRLSEPRKAVLNSIRHTGSHSIPAGGCRQPTRYPRNQSVEMLFELLASAFLPLVSALDIFFSQLMIALRETLQVRQRQSSCTRPTRWICHRPDHRTQLFFEIQALNVALTPVHQVANIPTTRQYQSEPWLEA